MPENVNTAPLIMPSTHTKPENGRSAVISVDNVSMIFNMASEQLNSLKEYAIAIARRELMFKEFRALDSISFEVKKGDVFGILGTNGSGKSTLLKIVAGVLEPSEGTCTINGNIAPLIELGAGFDMELTARENIYLNGALLGYSRKFINQHFDEIVDFAEIEAFLDMPMKNYSSGMIARIAFAIATVIVPEILIVDEVLSVGDFMFQQKCERRITQLIKEHEVTVLIVSHNNDQIERLCNKAIWLEKGHIRTVGSATEVCRIYRALGGHLGSPESEEKVFNVLSESVSIPEGTLTTISGDDRYGTAVKLLEKIESTELDRSTRIIMTSGESDSMCLIANSLAGLLDAPILLAKHDSLPDVTSQALKRYAPEEVIVIGSQKQVSNHVTNELTANTEIAVSRIDGKNLAETAREVFRQGSKRGAWGSTAVISYDGCTGDTISLLPYICEKKAPLFFITTYCTIEQETIYAILSGSFDRLIVLGGQASFPDSCLEPFRNAGMEIVRFCGTTPYHANELINNWTSDMLKTDSYIESGNLIVSPLGNPVDTFAVGPYAKATHSLILIVEPQDLDSVAHAFDFIKSRKGAIKSLIFLGDSTRFSKLDKEILGKVVTQALAL